MLPDHITTQAEWDQLIPRANGLFQAARKSHYSHNAEAQALIKKNQEMSIAAAILAGVSGVSALSHFSGLPGWEHVKPLIETIQGLGAIAAAVISTLQSKLNYTKMADMHRHCAVEYGAIRRNLKTTFHMPVHLRDDPRVCFSDVEEKLHSLANKSPQISKPIWDATETRLAADPSHIMDD